jgi:hypothetical protein
MTTVYLSNVIATKLPNKCKYELLFGCKPKLNSNLRTFGEVGVVTIKNRIQGKLENLGTMYMIVDYTENHSRDEVWMFTLRILELFTLVTLFSPNP